MNVQLLESVRRKIVLYPERFCAAHWAFARNARRVLQEGAAAKGFRACIAGHVLLEYGSHSERDLLREGGFHTGGPLWEDAASALGLDRSRCRELFFPSQWDKPYKQDYYLCGEDEEPTIAAAYLDYFMQKYGRPEEASVALPSAQRHELAEPEKTVARGERTAVPTS